MLLHQTDQLGNITQDDVNSQEDERENKRKNGVAKLQESKRQNKQGNQRNGYYFNSQKLNRLLGEFPFQRWSHALINHRPFCRTNQRSNKH